MPSLVLFRAIFQTFDPDTLWLNFAHWIWLQTFIYALVVIIFIDLEYFFIPDELSIPGTIGIGGAFLLPMYSGQTALIGAAVGSGFMLAISALAG